ncbi:jg24130 [Pararge aegeria aegeria]|uniref:Jg24130 protein n=1 Tax=Pararge aegeria aegeria TaxID=348720 RepID=A0A8S4RLX0_9NEOP|nr:jg24130 [Pararge aegeria aegeria]
MKRHKSQPHKRISQNLVNPISKLNTKRLAAASTVHRSIAVTVTDYPGSLLHRYLTIIKEYTRIRMCEF